LLPNHRSHLTLATFTTTGCHRRHRECRESGFVHVWLMISEFAVTRQCIRWWVAIFPHPVPHRSEDRRAPRGVSGAGFDIRGQKPESR
jgi:hypothetical protein